MRLQPLWLALLLVAHSAAPAPTDDRSLGGFLARQKSDDADDIDATAPTTVDVAWRADGAYDVEVGGQLWVRSGEGRAAPLSRCLSLLSRSFLWLSLSLPCCQCG